MAPKIFKSIIWSRKKFLERRTGAEEMLRSRNQDYEKNNRHIKKPKI